LARRGKDDGSNGLSAAGSEADVLWDQSRLLVRRSETNGKVMNMTKTAIRYSVHLPSEVMDILRWHVESHTVAQQRSDLLFPSETGGFRAGSALKKAFADVVDAMGLEFKLTPRGMRRTFQDLARAAQVQDLVTRSVSGHATSDMQRHYSTVNASEQHEGLMRVLSGHPRRSVHRSGGKAGGRSRESGGNLKRRSPNPAVF